MISPEKIQDEVCLLKSSLKKAENEMLVQRSALPRLDTENEQKFQDKLKLVKKSLEEIEANDQENIRLEAICMHLYEQEKELAKAIKKAQNDSDEIEKACNNLKQEIEQLVRKCEDSFRNKRASFNDRSKIKQEREKMKSLMRDLEGELMRRRCQVETLIRQLETLTTKMPENLMEIIGKNNVDDTVKARLEERDARQEKRNELVKKRKE